MSTRAELEREYATKDGIIRNPGKFEGEPLWVPYFWVQGLDGCANLDVDGEDGSPPIWAFQVTDEDRTQFPELAKVYAVALEESDHGFVFSWTLTEAEYAKLENA